MSCEAAGSGTSWPELAARARRALIGLDGLSAVLEVRPPGARTPAVHEVRFAAPDRWRIERAIDV